MYLYNRYFVRHRCYILFNCSQFYFSLDYNSIEIKLQYIILHWNVWHISFITIWCDHHMHMSVYTCLCVLSFVDVSTAILLMYRNNSSHLWLVAILGLCLLLRSSLMKLSMTVILIGEFQLTHNSFRKLNFYDKNCFFNRLSVVKSRSQ